MRHIHVKYYCATCQTEGFSPEVTAKEALALSRNELQLRCPICGTRLSIQASERQVASEMFRHTVETATWAGIIQQQILQTGEHQLQVYIEDSITAIFQDTLPQKTRAKLQRTLKKSIKKSMRSDVTHIHEEIDLVRFPSCLQTVAQKVFSSQERSAICERLSSDIEKILPHSVASQEKKRFVDHLEHLIEHWYQETVSAVIPVWTGECENEKM